MSDRTWHKPRLALLADAVDAEGKIASVLAEGLTPQGQSAGNGAGPS